MSERPTRRVAAFLVAVLAAAAALLPACGSGATPATAPSSGPALLEPDAGWVAAGGAGFQPAPFGQGAAVGPGGSTLVAATGSEARVKWVAQRAAVPGSEDARSRVAIHVVDVTDPAAHADVTCHGAGVAGFADLPIEAGKRTVYRLSWTAVGTYRRCSVLIEVRTQ